MSERESVCVSTVCAVWKDIQGTKVYYYSINEKANLDEGIELLTRGRVGCGEEAGWVAVEYSRTLAYVVGSMELVDAEPVISTQ